MNVFRAVIKEIRAEIESIKGREAFLELLGEGDDVERLIGQRKAALAQLDDKVAQTATKIADANAEAAAIVEAAQGQAREIVAVAEDEKNAAISEAVLKALQETGDKAADIISKAKVKAEADQADADAKLEAANAELDGAQQAITAAKAELAEIEEKIAAAEAARQAAIERLQG